MCLCIQSMWKLKLIIWCFPLKLLAVSERIIEISPKTFHCKKKLAKTLFVISQKIVRSRVASNRENLHLRLKKVMIDLYVANKQNISSSFASLFIAHLLYRQYSGFLSIDSTEESDICNIRKYIIVTRNSKLKILYTECSKNIITIIGICHWVL